MSFRATNARAAALQLARQRAALKAQEIRNEAVQMAPVDSGRLRQSISVQQQDADTWRTGTNVEYSTMVEFGTRHQKAQPFMRPAVEKVRKRG